MAVTPAAIPPGPQFNKTTLDSGIRILTEYHDDTRCVETGFWLDRGTRDETPDVQGVAHLLEHMVFKGTKKLNTLEIAKKIEAVGGEINAFTTKEHTCFHTSTLAEDFSLGVDVLSQLFFQAELDPNEYDKEKTVVLQEILMAKDDIEDRVFDSYFAKSFANHPLGWMILGTDASVDRMSRDQVYDWYKKTYLPQNLIISVVGSIKHEDVVSTVEKFIGQQQPARNEHNRSVPKWSPWRQLDRQENCEQVHVLFGFECPKYGSEQRFDAYILNTMLGGGMTSKLYQKVREENGWAYSVFSMLNTHTDSGSHLMYAATDQNFYQQVGDAFAQELDKVITNKVSSKELEFYRKQAKGQILIASEDIESRMHSLAVNEMVFGEYKPVDSVIDEMGRISVESLNAYIDKWLSPDQLQAFVFGPVDEDECEKWMGNLWKN